MVRLSAKHPSNIVPFYYKTGDGEYRFDCKEIRDTWLTDIEYRQLVLEKWQIKVIESVAFDDHFSMEEYVDKLEHLRVTAPGGPNGAQGMVMKAIGNNSYGKTVEALDGIEVLMSKEQPEGFSEWLADDMPFQHAWFRITKAEHKPYHQPHLGCWITSHVRMVLRRAILLKPEDWLYSDTDCIIFKSDVLGLDVHASRYGAWKQETNGEIYRIVTKKVYANLDASVKHAKGVNTKYLTAEDFKRWYTGIAPEQLQIQRVNFARVMSGEEMFRERLKHGPEYRRKKERKRNGSNHT